ncbi:hypothetical protein JCM6882_007863 [Rhodosporidiobolus microsporus]
MNNPFAAPPRTQQTDAANRFPDVLNQDPDLQLPHYQQQPQQQYGQQYGGYAQQQQPQLGIQTTGFQQQPHQQSSFLSPQGTGFGAPSPSYGGAGGYGGGGYGQPSPQPAFNTSDLDPYASLGALSGPTGVSSFGGGGQPQQQQQGGAGGGGAGATLLQVQQTQSHPRQFVQENKAQLMLWEEYAWKQLLGRVDALREAWETRKAGIQAAANQGADPTSADHLRKQADNYVDSCHAAKMQLDEVKTGWRHSTDAASKARVREALNAGLSSLPEYPPPLHPSELGGAFHRQAEQSWQKNSIMSQFSAGPSSSYQQQQPQQTGYQQQGYGGGGMMQPQQTGYGGGGGYGGMQQQMQPQMTGYMPQQQTGFGGQGGYGAGMGGYGGQQGGYY